MKVSYFRKISKMMISSFIFLFIIALIIDSIQSFDINYLKKASLFADEICSFSGDPILKDDGNVVECKCYQEYANNPSEDGQINGSKIQCSYTRKRKFITVFFAIFLPFGIEYFYLERYWVFFLILFLCCFSIIGNCVRFTISNTQENYFKNKVNLIFIILFIMMVLFTITNAVLMLIGLIKDGNGIEVYNDLYLLTSISNE